eukprot:c37329_g1_i1 orf=42-191(-)
MINFLSQPGLPMIYGFNIQELSHIILSRRICDEKQRSAMIKSSRLAERE